MTVFTDIAFPESYREGRAAFLAAAEAAGLSTITRVHPGALGADGKPLFLDTVVAGHARASRALLLIAGAHGYEDRFGSAAVTGFLRAGGFAGLAEDACVVLLHAFNPFGCSHVRYTDENGVDVSCNLVDFSSPPPASSATYDAFAALIGSAGAASGLREAAVTAFLQVHGETALSDLMLRGQHRDASGPFFGGSRPGWSHAMLLDILHEELRLAESVVLVDLRTGWGTPGATTLFSAEPAGSEGARLVARLFGAGVICGAGDRSLFARAPRRIFRVTVCVGTLGPREMFRALCQACAEGGADPALLREAFCPSAPHWRRAARAAAVRAARRAFEGFARG